MSQELFHDDDRGSTAVLDGDEYSFQNEDGETIVTVPVDEIGPALDILDNLADPDTDVDGVEAPRGDGWLMGQVRHPLFGMPIGIGFKNTETEDGVIFTTMEPADAGRLADALRQ